MHRLLYRPAAAYKGVVQPTLRLFGTAAVAFALASVSLRGQATSQIQGIVKDPTGGAVAGAQIKATQTQTNEVHTFTSDAEGNYIFLSLPIGPYKMEAGKAGFTTLTKTDVELVVTGQTVNFSLQVGTTPQIVTVRGDASQIDTRTISIGTFVGNERINDLSLNGRNAADLIQYAGAAVPAGKNNTNGYPGGQNIAIAGGQLYGISYQLDGTMYNNLLDATNLPFPFPDALQEFKVETSTLTAQNGTHASGAVSASIKSGTNQFHGDLFEFFRNGEMNARNTIATRSDTLKRNQFGGTIGGPIVKNKIFFFAGYQGTRTRSDPLDSPPAFVPTAQMLAGDFSGCPSFKAIKDPANAGAPFVGNQIPVGRFSSQALKVVDFLPKSSDPCGKVFFGSIIKSNEHQVLGRIDYSINSKHQIFGRYMASAFAQPPSYGLSGNILATGNSDSGGLDDLAQTAALGYTYLASPNVINQFRLAFNRVAVRRFTADYFSGCDIGVNMYCYVPHTIINVTGGFTIGSNPASQGSFIPTYLTFSDDLSVVRGAHAFAFGFSSFKYQHSQNTTVNTAIFLFNVPTAGTGFGLTDFMLGVLGRMTQSTPATVFTNKWGHGLYAQDTWRITRRLTLNYGIRWEPFLPQALNNGAVYNFSLDAFKAGVRSQVRTNSPAGLSYPGDPGFQGKTGVNKRWNQFAPRVGIAFDPRGNGMTSIRASAGIAYDFPNLQIMSDPSMAPPFASLINTNGPVPFGDPYRGANPYPVVPESFVPFGTYIAQQPDAKVPTTYTWNFSVQHQIGRDWLVSASYAGSQSAHLWVTRQLNPAVIVPGPIDSSCAATATDCNSTNNTNRRRLSYLANPTAPVPLGPVDMFDSSGNSNYHGLIFSTQKRFNRGVSFNANYTWSHCIGDMVMGSGPGNGSAGINGVNIGGPGGSYSDGNDRRRDRGNCGASTIAGLQALDRRRIFNFTTVLEAPKFDDRVLNHIASNWKLSSSYRFLSSSFLSATNGGTDVALTGAAGQRANQLLEDVYCKPRNANCWINPAAFAIPAAGTLGNAGRSNIEGPGFFGLDMALSRIFRFDPMSLEVRGEAFNLTNSVRLNSPVTARNDNAGNFGKVLTAQDPRILQVALKLVF